MPSDRTSKGEQFRLWVWLIVTILAFLFLGSALGYIQLLEESEYKSSFEKQTIRRVRLPARRGLILDRNGTVLADNDPSYCVAIYIEELRQPGSWSNTIDKVTNVISSVAQIMGRTCRVKPDEIRTHIKKRLPLPFIAWRNLDGTAVARLAENPVRLPGVDIVYEPVRTYPQGTCAAHVIGHVGRKAIDPDERKRDPYNYYLPEMEGKSGLERIYNDVMAGQAGGYVITVDATGYRHEKKDDLPPKAGSDIRLAIDLRIQKLVEAELAHERGAAVILDPRNGDVLAMASSPAFDPNAFVPRISTEDWNAIRLNKSKPLLNRATNEIYPPGSTFKPVVAIAALESKRASEYTQFDCCGYYQLGNIRFHCWNRYGHGTIKLRQALEGSCNPYFCQLGLQCGYDPIYHLAEALGLGRKTGIELRYEEDGNLPPGRSKGDTCNVSIGQGALAVTPLQMAVIVSTIANQGTLYRPRLVLEGDNKPGSAIQTFDWSPTTMRVVRGGMHDVVNSEHGTAKLAKAPGVDMAGKTGTAQYGLKSQGKKHVWMIAFAPFEAPRYAIAMVIEDGESGGRTVGPRIARIMAGIRDLDGAMM